jgi:ABC-2 type transport system ATP-binding protein
VSEVAIHVDGLVKTFRRKRWTSAPDVHAVNGLSFSVRRGEIFGLLGPNGAGKTTTLRILTTLVRPTSGVARVLGYDVVNQALDVRKRIVVVIQEQAAELLLSVRDNLLTFARFHGLSGPSVRRRADEVLDLLGLRADAGRKPQDLSGGFRRRVQLAKVFMVDTPVIFLDEFSSGMDPILKRSVMELLRKEVARGRTIVLTTQILTEAEELCDDILIIDHGQEIAHGDLNTLKLLTEQVYEVALTFDRAPDDVEELVSGYRVVRREIAQNTLQLAMRESETRVLELVSALAARRRLLRLEINGASLEDIFIALTRESAGSARDAGERS